MKFEIGEYSYHFFNDMPGVFQNMVSQFVSDYTNGKCGEIPQMLPVTKEEVFAKYLGLVVFKKDGGFAGYVGAKDPEEHMGQQMSEVGTLWVPERYQKQGLGTNLVVITSELLTLAGITPYAFCNQYSSGIFSKNGYVEAKPEMVKPSVYDDCINCPLFEIKGKCCDTLYIYEGAQ